MELVIWGLLIGMVAMVWLMVAASVQDHTAPDECGDKESSPALQKDQAPSGSLTTRQTRVAA